MCKYNFNPKRVIRKPKKITRRLLRDFGSAEWKLRSLEVWQLGGLKRRLSWGFACADFINPFNPLSWIICSSQSSHFISFLFSQKLHFGGLFTGTAFADAQPCQNPPTIQPFNRKGACTFTMAERRSSASEQRVECWKHVTRFLRVEQESRFPILGCRLAFTMAEILISLTIIGIIAAITLPALQANINEKTWATKRKALYSRMSQAIALMPNLNGYGVVFNNDGTMNETETANKAAQVFISDGLSKVLKINNICGSANLQKCGFPGEFNKMGKNSKIITPTTLADLNEYFSTSNNYADYSQINAYVAAFETVNGESILTFYNPNCSYVPGMNNASLYQAQNLMQPTMCVNFIYDLNGKKGPNKVGNDIGFMTAFYPTDSQIVAPYPITIVTVYKSEYPQFSIGAGNAICREKLGNDARMANIEELKSIFTNNTLGNLANNVLFLPDDGVASSTAISNTKLYALRGFNGAIIETAIDYYGGATYRRIFCVKK